MHPLPDKNGRVTDLPELPQQSFAATSEPSPRPVAPRTDGSAVAALLCAIGSWILVPVVLAVVALALARKADRVIDAHPTELSGRGLVTGARWIAWTRRLIGLAPVQAPRPVLSVAACGR